ncbi:UNKNOWN [Stylonychia lemnae]|uniref:Uncharacterized protein n=1 Tax=Stylonychia lemnae TaxID=5949 RepID=A0A078AX54_STYLE|nr:UNKNOWN [Stylonychia lemnae]|eukprot:CDW86749.1 UNKNOWN [Stylonychia lemnae]
MDLQIIANSTDQEIDSSTLQNHDQQIDFNSKQNQNNRKQLDSRVCGIFLLSNKYSILEPKETYILIKNKDPMKISLIKQTSDRLKETPKNQIILDHNTDENIEKIRENLIEKIPGYGRNGIIVLSDNRDNEFLYINPCNGKKYRQYDDKGNRYLRSDILYKTISRDMRKFFSKDFNAVTGFILIKNRKENFFFLRQIGSYLQYRFPELYSKYQVQEKQINQDNNLIFNDLILFFGCLIYPKEVYKSLIIQNGNSKNEAPNESIDCRTKMNTISESNLKKMFHQSLNKFSLEKLYKLINTEFYAYFFCHYFSKQVLRTDYLETKKYNLDNSNGSHYPAFVLAYNLLLNLSQLTLIKSIRKINEKQKYEQEQYQQNMINFVHLKPKSMILFRITKENQSKIELFQCQTQKRKNLKKRFSGTRIQELERVIQSGKQI